MYALALGVILLFLKYMEIGPVANWSWGYIFAPFIVAAAWWAFADATGFTKRKAMEKMEKRRQKRVDRNRQNLGLGRKKN